MAEDHYITAQEAEKAKKEPLKVTPRPTGAHIFAAEYFAEEVRRYVYENYTEKKLYEGGLSVRTTLDPKMQVLARKVLVDGFVNFDEQQGYRGPVNKLDMASEWGGKLADIKALADIAPWRLAVVLEVEDGSARIGLQPGRDPGGAVSKERETGVLPLEGMKWAKPTSGPTKGKTPTKVVAGAERRRRHLCRAARGQGGPVPPAPGARGLRRHRGDGSADRARARDGRRLLLRPEPVQPRDPGAASARLVVQAAGLCRRARQRLYALDRRHGRADRDRSPAAASGRRKTIRKKFYGPSTLRFGIEQSRNVMTVRLAQDVGMPLIGEYAKRFGVYDSLPPYLSFALGAGETTLLRMVGAYAMFDNGGRKIQPTLIDRIQDRYGRTIYRHDSRECRGCDADKWANQNEPTLVDKRERVLDPMTAYQITSMMEGVVQRGTAHRGQGGRQADRRQDRHHQRREGRLVHRLLARPRGRRLSRLRQAAPPRPRRHRRRAGGADRARFHEGRARRQARGSVPGAGRHQAHPHRSQERHAGRARAISG